MRFPFLKDGVPLEKFVICIVWKTFKIVMLHLFTYHGAASILFQNPSPAEPLTFASDEMNPEEWKSFDYCACDLTRGVCDPYCCCDPDCPQSAINSFGYCLPEITGNKTSITYCDDVDNTTASFISFLESNFLCVNRDDNPVKGDFYGFEDNQPASPLNSFDSLLNSDLSVSSGDLIPGQTVSDPEIIVWVPDNFGYCYPTSVQYYIPVDTTCMIATGQVDVMNTEYINLSISNNEIQCGGTTCANQTDATGVATTKIVWQYVYSQKEEKPANQFEYQEEMNGFTVGGTPVRFMMNSEHVQLTPITNYSFDEIKVAFNSSDTIPESLSEYVYEEWASEEELTDPSVHGITKIVNVLFEEKGNIYAPKNVIKEISVKVIPENWIGPEFNWLLSNSMEVWSRTFKDDVDSEGNPIKIPTNQVRFTRFVRFFKLPNSINTKPQKKSLWRWLPF